MAKRPQTPQEKSEDLHFVENLEKRKAKDPDDTPTLAEFDRLLRIAFRPQIEGAIYNHPRWRKPE